MTNQLINTAILSGVLAGACQVAPADSDVARKVVLERLPHATLRISQLDSGLTHGATNLRIDSKQIFVIKSSKTPDLTLVPVAYLNGTAQSAEQRCGIFFLPRSGPQSFVGVIGEDYPWNCEELEAVGSMPGPEAKPRIIAVYRTMAPSGAISNNSYILSWNPQASAYELNKAQTNWLFRHRVPADTIAKARRLLALYPTNWYGEPYGKPIE